MMIQLTSFALLAVCMGMAAGQDNNNCLPSCTNATAGDKVPDPLSCHNYYICLATNGPSDVAFECPDGYKFDISSKPYKCKLDSNTIKCGTCTPKCHYDCYDSNSYAAVRGDCSKFQLCAIKPPIEVNCNPPTSYFDGEGCQEDASKCCDPCAVYCQAGNIETADPTSCHHFYFCSEEGFPQEQDRFECPDEEIFDITASTCTIGALCVEPCAATATTTTTTTTTTTIGPAPPITTPTTPAPPPHVH